VVFVVDDTKFDNTIPMIKAYNDYRFEIIANDGKTTCANARNLGWETRRDNKYCIFLDSDDWMEPERLQTQVRYMEQRQTMNWVSSQVYSGTSIIDNKPGSSTIPCGTTSVMFKGSYLFYIFKRDGYIFKPDMKRYDDYDLVMRIRHDVSGHIQKPLTTLFDNPEGLSRTQHPFWGNFDLWKCVVRNTQWDLLPSSTEGLLRSIFIRG
jgi:glycosyltransferase involved in cell wall biosynthesis